MAAFTLTVRTAVRGYHVYKDIKGPGNRGRIWQEPGSEEDSYAVAVCRDSESSSVLGHLPHVSFFLEHDSTITGKVTS